jgi:signal transduction histidine kinase
MKKGRDFLRRIVRATQRLDRLLTDISGPLARANAWDPPIDEIGADDLVREVVRRLERLINSTGARITVRAPLPRLRVNTTWGRPGPLQSRRECVEVLSPPGDAPDIEIAPHVEIDPEGAESVGLVVRDRGPGVPPDQRERIFELFRRAVGTRRRRNRGRFGHRAPSRRTAWRARVGLHTRRRRIGVFSSHSASTGRLRKR